MNLRKYVITPLIVGIVAIGGCTLNRQYSNRTENQQQTFRRNETYEERLWREHREKDGTKILSETGKADRYSIIKINFFIVL
ncbi:hypothetical protein HYT25_02440 [Candidatus Pacearchaeota archaeon]|nr:hypothetical protein [Candidatus Pacearchaeota archaeon]